MPSHVTGNGYPITASGAVDTDYRITYQPGTASLEIDSLTELPDALNTFQANAFRFSSPP